MLPEISAGGQGKGPDLPNTADTPQPDQAPQTKQEKMRAYKRAYNSQWRKDHPDRAKEISRNSARKRRATAQGREHYRNYMRGWRKGKKDERGRASALTNEQWGDLPPLHPIFMRLSEALYKQQTSPAGETDIFPEPGGRPATPQSPTPDRPRSTRERRNP